MGLFSKPEVVIAKESSNAKEYLRQLEELAEKATGENAKKIAKEIAVVKAGIIGEDNILFELKNSGMDMVVLHDLYIESVSGSRNEGAKMTVKSLPHGRITCLRTFLGA